MDECLMMKNTPFPYYRSDAEKIIMDPSQKYPPDVTFRVKTITPGVSNPVYDLRKNIQAARFAL